jgi:hypothetical protein
MMRTVLITFFAVGLAACGSGSSALSPDAAPHNPDAASLGATGDPCTLASDCTGTTPTCILNVGGLAYPGGFCSSHCDATKNDPSSEINPACPGTGTCVGTSCGVLCGAGTCRTGYSCFNSATAAVCLPTALSQCDPTVAGSCADTTTTCDQVGQDPVGQCDPKCDPFAQDCADSSKGCFANPQSGVGTCAGPNPNNGDGVPCNFENDCANGLGCYVGGSSPVCRPYCGGPNNVACTNGKTCVDLSATVPQATVGVCGG